LKSEDNTSSNSMLVARGGPYVKKNNRIVMKCRKFEKLGHVRNKCLDWATWEKTLIQVLEMSPSL